MTENQPDGSTINVAIEHKPEDRLFIGRLRSISLYLSMITVEPATFMFAIAWSLEWPTEYAFIYDKLCTLEFGADSHYICANLHNETLADHEDVVQTKAAYWYLYGGLCAQFPPIVLAFLYGSLSDNFSRKIVLIIPLLGMTLEALCYVLQANLPSLPMWFYLIGKCFQGFGGGWTVFFLGAQSYVTHISEEGPQKTIRLAIVISMWSFALTISYFIGGGILDNTSYTFVFSIVFGIFVIALFQMIFFVKNIKPKQENVDSKPGKLQVFHNACKVLETGMKYICRKRPFNGRIHIVAALALIVFVLFGFSPMYVVSYLFLVRQPLSFSQTLYGVLNGYFSLLKSLSFVVIIPVSKRCGISDSSMLILSFISSILYAGIFAFSKETWMVFLSATMGVLIDITYLEIRAICASIATQEEIGKIYSLIGSIQSASELGSNAVFNAIYPLTLDIWAGLCFLIGAIIFIPALIISIWLHIDIKKYAHRVSPGVHHKKECNACT